MKKRSVDPWEGVPVTFEDVSLDQHLRFRALDPREKLQRLEGLAEFVDRVFEQRRAKGLPVVEPESKKRPV